MEKKKLDRYERAYRYVRNMAQQNCVEYTELCLRTDVIVEAIRKAQKYDKLKEAFDVLKYCFTESYGLDGYYKAGFLTVEEYDLLKEVFEDGKKVEE